MRRLIYILLLFALAGLLFKCTPRYKGPLPIEVKMNFYHKSKEYRGVPWWKNKDQRYGKGHPGLVKDPAADYVKED